ncbi:chemotaxis protein CheD [Agrobacterium vitis]|uniref:Probable chemoreceptor glutamine deamidase CheD n=3 Tax=Rhizobiaceae TaxID=82115 RepID=B9JXA9_ALLAM|nr:chemotaxis protein [Allorhizobium ampelinum S4]MCF1434960.1 chemotaxis protein CheD [Allorhizobium ampelinum]MUO31153.1 chemotaxis protein CheD [Agrobacterium vitis]MCF1446374.1 chemotaxis protein CheD [Allorhizobium ampelinum]MCF1461094.1 chemotaxis protein CheD [Allorhizobium ampelinum]
MSFVWNAPVASRMDLPKGRVTISQGQFAVSDDPDTVMTTVLGSCVAACIRDPVLGLGGMNHFVLPGPVAKGMSKSEAARYGCQLMELLVDGLLARGANVWRLEAKIFGGASPGNSFYNVGARNFDFARQFLATNGIAVIEENVGGPYGCKLEYWPYSGKTNCVPLSGRMGVKPKVTAIRSPAQKV